MGSDAIIFPAFFAVIFAIFYLFISARHKERIALIEKGADASIFSKGTQRTTWIWKILILNLGLLSAGIGIGIFLAGTLHLNFGIDKDVAYPGAIFLIAGISLIGGFFLTEKFGKEN